MNFAYLAAAIVPTVVIMAYILRHDEFEKEPKQLLFKLFFYGCLTVIPAVILESVFAVNTDTLFGLAIECFFVIALSEELVKYIVARKIALNSPSYDEIYDGIIYCVFISLGFATIENILYVLQSGLGVAVLRAVTAVPAHAIFGVHMGYYMSLYKSGQRRKEALAFSLIMPVVVHGFYDFILFTGWILALFIFIPYMVWLYSKSIKFIKSTYQSAPFDNFE
ncbi:MAG: PrsW family glutamic-type intramembrane protease [Eubacteriaceae bacterium]|nr:PrsW family glutamic-type intramembrane protease [Eubacteriaceae bacterium]